MSSIDPETRQRLAISAAAIMAMPQLLEAINAEVEATFAEHLTLPKTEESRRILFALSFPKIAEQQARRTA